MVISSFSSHRSVICSRLSGKARESITYRQTNFQIHNSNIEIGIEVCMTQCILEPSASRCYVLHK